MPKTLAALFLVLTAAVGTFAVPATARAAQTSDAKVVIIVGATHGATSDYRSKADQAYAEAKKYTPNVYKVYSPNATWSKVKSATVNASVVIYLGHGNGWPSPYPKDSAYTTKDGFGLNATAGNGDSNTKYYGEPYVSTLDLAPNAVILLHHLCYASGNSEPGNPAPTRSVAKQRVDNYGAGFLTGRRQCRHRRWPPRRGRLPARPVHHRPAPGRPVAHPAQLPRQRVLVRVHPNIGQDRAHGSGHVDLGLLPLHGRQPERDDDPGAERGSREPAAPAAYAVMSVFSDLGKSKFVRIHPVDLRREDHERLHRHPLLPGVRRHPRPDGQLHRPGDGPPGCDAGLLQRRQRPDP